MREERHGRTGAREEQQRDDDGHGTCDDGAKIADARDVGMLVMGMDVEMPDTMNSPITAAYVSRHSTHTALSTKNAA